MTIGKDDLKFQPWISLRDPESSPADIVQDSYHWLDVPNYHCVELELGTEELGDEEEVTSLPCLESSGLDQALENVSRTISRLSKHYQENPYAPFPSLDREMSDGDMPGVMDCLDLLMNQCVNSRAVLELQFYEDGEARCSILDWSCGPDRRKSNLNPGPGFCIPDERCEECSEGDKPVGPGSYVRIFRTADGRRVMKFILDLRDWGNCRGQTETQTQTDSDEG